MYTFLVIQPEALLFWRSLKIPAVIKYRSILFTCQRFIFLELFTLLRF